MLRFAMAMVTMRRLKREYAEPRMARRTEKVARERAGTNVHESASLEKQVDDL